MARMSFNINQLKVSVHSPDDCPSILIMDRENDMIVLTYEELVKNKQTVDHNWFNNKPPRRSD